MPKTCTKCGETKAAEMFHRQARSKDGRRSCCKSCELAYARKRGNLIRDHVCADCGTTWQSKTFKPIVCAACSIRRAQLANVKEIKIGRRFEMRPCSICDQTWRVRSDAKSQYCPRCRAAKSGAAAKRRHARNRPGLSIERNCKQCGRVFMILKSSIAPWNKTTNATGEFCDKTCFTIWQTTHWEGVWKRHRGPGKALPYQEHGWKRQR